MQPAARLEPLSVAPEGTWRWGRSSARRRLRSGRDLADGSRVFFTATSGGLYVRDAGRPEPSHSTLEQPGAFGTGSPNRFSRARAPTASVAFFTDTQNLTEDANESGADLYRCALRVKGAN